MEMVIGMRITFKLSEVDVRRYLALRPWGNSLNDIWEERAIDLIIGVGGCLNYFLPVLLRL